MSISRLLRIALFGALLLCPRPGAAEQCEAVPMLVQIGHGVFLASTELRCQPIEFSAPGARLQETREWLALCHELGGTFESCVSGVLEAAPPSYETLVSVVGRQREAPEAVRVTSANPLAWRDRLLTNGAVESLAPVKRAVRERRQRATDRASSRRE